jgi:hypothetical protein
MRGRVLWLIVLLGVLVLSCDHEDEPLAPDNRTALLSSISINIQEKVRILDQVGTLLPISIKVTESLHALDAVNLILPLRVQVNEAVRMTDAVVVAPK